MFFQITVYFGYGEIHNFEFNHITVTLFDWIMSYFNISDIEGMLEKFRKDIDINFLTALQEYLLSELKTPITTNRYLEFRQIGEWLYLINWILTLPLDDSNIYLGFN